MAIVKKSLVIPLDSGINESVDGFQIGAADAAASNVLFDKDGVVRSGFMLERVQLLGAADEVIHSVVDVDDVPVSVGSNGLTRMDLSQTYNYGNPAITDFTPACTVSSEVVRPQSQWIGKAHSACNYDDTNFRLVTATVYSRQVDGVGFIRLSTGDNLPLIDESVSTNSGNNALNCRVVALRDPVAFSGITGGNVFAVLYQTSGSAFIQYTIYNLDGVVHSRGTTTLSCNDTSKQFLVHGSQDYLSVGVVFYSLAITEWLASVVQWTAPLVTTSPSATLVSHTSSTILPVALHHKNTGGSRHNFVLMSNGKLVKASSSTILANNGITSRLVQVGSVGVADDTTIVAIVSRFERVGGLTSMGSDRAIFGDLLHFKDPPASPSLYQNRITTEVYRYNFSTLAENATVTTLSGCAAVSSMVASQLKTTEMYVVLNTAFPNATPDIRTGCDHYVVAPHATVEALGGVPRHIPDVLQCRFPGPPTVASPYSDGENGLAVKERQAGANIGIQVSLTVNGDEIKFPVLGGVFTAVAGAVGALRKQRTYTLYPDVRNVIYGLPGATLEERNQHARWYGMNDVATSNWYESDGRCVLCRVDTSDGSISTVAVLPGTPFHRQLAAKSSSITVPGSVDTAGGGTEFADLNDALFPEGFFQSSFLDDVGVFSQVPSLGFYEENLEFPQVSSDDLRNGVHIRQASVNLSTGRAFTIPSKNKSIVATSAGLISVGTNNIAPASPQPPHFIGCGDSEEFTGATFADTEFHLNTYDHRPGTTGDNVVGGMLYVRYRWNTDDGEAVSALSPPLHIYQYDDILYGTKSHIPVGAIGGTSSTACKNYNDGSERLARTTAAYFSSYKDYATMGTPQHAFRRPYYVNEPLTGSDNVLLDVFIDPWLGTFNTGIAAAGSFVGTTYNRLITAFPIGQPVYVGTVKPNRGVPGRLSFYVGAVNGGDDELQSIGPNVGAYVAPEALGPRPFQLPAAKSAFQYGNRAIVLGVDNNLYYSNPVVGVPEFSDELVIQPPPGSGDVIGAAGFEDRLVLFCRDRIYAYVGDLPDVGGGALGWSTLTTSIGCKTADSIAVTSIGMVFQGASGIHTITPGGDVQFVGRPVMDLTGDLCLGVANVPSRSCVMFNFGEFVLVYHHILNKWSTIDLAEGSYLNHIKAIGEDVWGVAVVSENVFGVETGRYVSVKLVAEADPASALSMREEVLSTGWVSLAGANGYQRCNRITVMGKAEDAVDSPACEATVNIYVNGLVTPDHTAVFDLVDLTDASGHWRLVTYPMTQKCHSIRIEVSVTPAVEAGTLSSVGTRGRPRMVYYGVNLDLGIKNGSFKQVSSDNKG